MTSKNFRFDFNEDAEPVEELHRLRVAMTEHFKTVEALVEYDRSLPTAKEMIAELKAETAGQKVKAARSRKGRVAAKAVRQRKEAVCVGGGNRRSFR